MLAARRRRPRGAGEPAAEAARVKLFFNLRAANHQVIGLVNGAAKKDKTQ